MGVLDVPNDQENDKAKSIFRVEEEMRMWHVVILKTMKGKSSVIG